MPDINSLTSQVRQNIAEQQKNRNEIEQNNDNITNNVSGTLSSQINELGNEKSKQGTVILDLTNELNKTSDEVERKEIQGKLDDARDFMNSLDDDIEKLNKKNTSAQSLGTSIKNGTAIQDNFKNSMKATAKDDEPTTKNNNTIDQGDGKATLDEMSSELKKSQSVLNKILNGGK